MRELYDRVSKHPRVTRQPLVLRQFVKFSLVGGINTIIDLGMYVLLTRVADLYFVLAGTISFILAATNSYFLNRAWTFRDNSRNVPLQFLKFFLAGLTGLGLNTGTLFVLVRYAGIHDVVAKILAIVLVVAWNFSVNKFWVFTDAQKRN